MRILAFSDVHGDLDVSATLVAAADKADLVIGAGDFASAHSHLQQTMAALEPIAEKAIYVPGNNETADALIGATSALVLHGDATVRDGVNIVGIGAAIPPLPHIGWDSYDLAEEDAASMLARFETADILITHSPPKGVADVITGRGSIGSWAVKDAISRLQPKLVLCGHVHDCWGRSGQIGKARIFNLGPSVNWFDAG